MGKLTFYKKTLAFCKIPWYHLTCVSGCGSAWLERRLREAEVASSNPATPMNENAENPVNMRVSAFFIFAGIQKVIKKVINAGKEIPAEVLQKINRPQIGLFFCAKTGEVFKKIGK